MNKSILLLLSFICALSAGQVDVCIDPGHGGQWPDGDPGAVNPNYPDGHYESNFNLEIA